MALDDIAIAPERQAPQKSKLRVIDADSHMDPPYEMWSEYLPAHLR